MESSGGGEKPRAYLDGGTLVARGRGAADIHHDGAARVCDAAMRNGFQMITSRLAVMDMISVLRRRVASSLKCRPGSMEDLSASDAHVQRAVAHAIDLLNGMERRGDLVIMELVGGLANLDRLRVKLLEHPGRVVPRVHDLSCRHCGVGPYDLIQYALAEEAGASVICTTDAALADIAGSDGEFAHIQIQVTGRPLIGPLSGNAA